MGPWALGPWDRASWDPRDTGTLGPWDWASWDPKDPGTKFLFSFLYNFYIYIKKRDARVPGSQGPSVPGVPRGPVPGSLGPRGPWSQEVLGLGLHGGPALGSHGGLLVAGQPAGQLAGRGTLTLSEKRSSIPITQDFQLKTRKFR